MLLLILDLSNAYTCTFSTQHTRLLCRHGTKSSSGVFDARRITILYLQQDVEQDATMTVLEQEEEEENSTSLSKRQKLKRLLRHMKSVAPKLRICLPSFMARLKSLETDVDDNDDEEDVDDSIIDKETNGVNNSLMEDEVEEEGDDRSATAASHVDLSGTWRPIVTPEFKQEYDQYLQNCSQSFMFRKVIVNGIALQKEIIHQLHQGKDLQIVASNPAGNWNRTLVASTADDPVHVTLQDPDGDTVQVEAWWEDSGRIHKSWLRNKPRLLGGAFETSRYLSEEDPNVLLCDSIFHPSPDAPKGFQYGRVLWKFQRVAS